MAGSVFGNIFKISTWGESHGEGLGVVIDGCPAGLPLCEEDIQEQLDRRKPGQSKFTTPRKEDDEVHILSGVFEGKTTGTPISLAVYNKTQRSADYSDTKSAHTFSMTATSTPTPRNFPSTCSTTSTARKTTTPLPPRLQTRANGNTWAANSPYRRVRPTSMSMCRPATPALPKNRIS